MRRHKIALRGNEDVKMKLKKERKKKAENLHTRAFKWRWRYARTASTIPLLVAILHSILPSYSLSSPSCKKQLHQTNGPLRIYQLSRCCLQCISHRKTRERICCHFPLSQICLGFSLWRTQQQMNNFVSIRNTHWPPLWLTDWLTVFEDMNVSIQFFRT